MGRRLHVYRRLRMAVNPTWPWTTETTTQGFLSGRWLRRDGDVYGGAAALGVKGANSPVVGGEDENAKVDVSSGAPRSGNLETNSRL